MFRYDLQQDFNRYINLDTLEGRIVYVLVNSRSQHALDLWNMLRYDDIDCLVAHNVGTLDNPDAPEILRNSDITLMTKPEDICKMSRKLEADKRDEFVKEAHRYLREAWKKEISSRWSAVYLSTDESSNKKVFLFPFVDDAWTARGARLDIYVDDIEPKDHIVSTMLVGVDIIVHNKENNITNPGSDNPAEFDTVTCKGCNYCTDCNKCEACVKKDECNIADKHCKHPDCEECRYCAHCDGCKKHREELITTTKSRATAMLKSVLAELNGLFVAGIGQMQLNRTMSTKSGVVRKVWNNRDYIGYQVVFASLISGVSNEPGVGY